MTTTGTAAHGHTPIPPRPIHYQQTSPSPKQIPLATSSPIISLADIRLRSRFKTPHITYSARPSPATTRATPVSLPAFPLLSPRALSAKLTFIPTWDRPHPH